MKSGFYKQSFKTTLLLEISEEARTILSLCHFFLYSYEKGIQDIVILVKFTMKKKTLALVILFFERFAWKVFLICRQNEGSLTWKIF